MDTREEPGSVASPTTGRGRGMRRAHVIVAAASVIVSLAVVEVGLRAMGFNDQIFTTADPVLGYSLSPGISQWQRLEGEALVTVNRDGYRGRSHPIDRRPGTFRIVVLGDSLTEGRQVAEEATYSAVIERELAQCTPLDGTGVEVLNFGVAGFSTAQELLMYRHRARLWSPDLVVLMVYVPNDLEDNTSGARQRHQPYFDLVDGQLVLNTDFRSSLSYRLRSSIVGQAFEWTKHRLRLLQLGGAALRGYRNWRAPKAERPGDDGPLFLDPDGTFAPPKEPRMVQAWDLLERLVQQIGREVEQDGATLIVADAPSPYAVHPDGDYRREIESFYGVDNLDYSERRLQTSVIDAGLEFVPLAEVMRAEAERSNECLSGFDNAVPCYGHWNEHGHRIVGRQMAEAMCSLLESQRQSALSPATQVEDDPRRGP